MSSERYISDAGKLRLTPAQNYIRQQLVGGGTMFHPACIAFDVLIVGKRPVTGDPCKTNGNHRCISVCPPLVVTTKIGPLECCSIPPHLGQRQVCSPSLLIDSKYIAGASLWQILCRSAT